MGISRRLTWTWHLKCQGALQCRTICCLKTAIISWIFCIRDGRYESGWWSWVGNYGILFSSNIFSWLNTGIAESDSLLDVAVAAEVFSSLAPPPGASFDSLRENSQELSRVLRENSRMNLLPPIECRLRSLSSFNVAHYNHPEIVVCAILCMLLRAQILNQSDSLEWCKFTLTDHIH